MATHMYGICFYVSGDKAGDPLFSIAGDVGIAQSLLHRLISTKTNGAGLHFVLGKVSTFYLTRYCLSSFLQFYSASFTEDLRQVVKHVHSRFPTSRLYAIGWSLGGNILINYLGQVKCFQGTSSTSISWFKL